MTIRSFLAKRNEATSATTAGHNFTTLRVFFRFLHADGLITINPTESIDAVKQRKPLLPTFSRDQVRAMLAACRDQMVSGLRDRALILLLFDTGLRVGEVCSLRCSAVNWTERTMLVEGKGSKQRLVPFGRAAAVALRAYLDRRMPDDGEGTLFGTNHGGPVHNGGPRAIFDFHLDGVPQHDAQGTYIRVGSWQAYNWFCVAVGRTVKATLANARRLLTARAKWIGTGVRFEYID